VGLGNGLVEPVPLEPGRIRQGHRDYALEVLDDGLWRFVNSAGMLPPDFDFRFAPADEALLARTCASLQSDDESLFRQNLICQRLGPEGVQFLIGRVLISYSRDGSTHRTLESREALGDVLTTVFELAPPNLDELWSRVLARHEALFAGTAEGGVAAKRA
jgi:N-hydroxyarylamine O-acetyltransferase